MKFDGKVDSQKYINEVLRPDVIRLSFPNIWIFQSDNAPPHTAQITSDFLEQNNIRVLPWHPPSPYLSPIGYFWDQLKRRLSAMSPLPHTVQELKDAIQYLYLTHPQDSIRTFSHNASLNQRLLSKLRLRNEIIDKRN